MKVLGNRKSDPRQFVCRLLAFTLFVFFAGCGETVTTDDQADIAQDGPDTSVVDRFNDENTILAMPINQYEEIDAHARECPDALEVDVTTLASYLGSRATSDIEKARAIYVWLTDNVSYDDDAFNSGEYGAYNPEGLLSSRKAVCEGFSNLYQALGEEMGLNIRKVSGYAKGFGYAPGRNFERSNHAWNAIEIDGVWKLFDATWGQGNGTAVNGKLVSKKEFDPYWFNIDPYEAIFNHFPQDTHYTFITPKITLSQYQQFPFVDKSYFAYGFDGKQVYEAILFDPQVEFPKCFHVNPYARVINAPEFGVLEKGQTYTFEWFVPEGIKMALIDSENEWTFFEKKNGRFSLDFIPAMTGNLKVSVQHEESGNSFGTLLIYQVRVE